MLSELFTKFDVLRIVRDHLHAFQNAKTKKPQKVLIFLIFIFPFILALFASLSFLDLSGFFQVLGNIYSIFCGLLFNLLVLMKNEYKEAKESEKVASQALINETYSNISFCILISLLGLLSLAFSAVPVCSKSFTQDISLICKDTPFYLPNVFIVYFFILFIFNMFFVIKRIYKICRPS